ncbi:MAG TPA: hypothetical protein VG675_03485 [Bryobacteraceae bacterium]|nr:hypothetical protein [Bryobacteraceae bacterium]
MLSVRNCHTMSKRARRSNGGSRSHASAPALWASTTFMIPMPPTSSEIAAIATIAYERYFPAPEQYLSIERNRAKCKVARFPKV